MPCIAVPENHSDFPLGKRKMRWLSETVQLYEPHPVDYFVMPVSRIVGQAFLMPNCENTTIPYHMKRFKKRAFPWGKHDPHTGNARGSTLWVVNHQAMLAGRSICN